ncbi:RHS repeat domain-containing protein [Pedobacter montanisoli]|uniref:RHS repeat-associated core domain-containing protein n=1 Tax=Pedobacter montanisoli TaxID=2923277 RepID=A0ABS9ZX09_9SPHI|nr:RHS repeat-associated core domain-containing protein [Pedobacter montanisoli]MCJ0742829.1 RHS repeat-associated core domain-containing protein [Pedobacter montanisoli]
MTKGLATGSLVNVLGTTDNLLTVTYYDDYGRVKKTFGQHYKGGTVSSGNYDEVTSTWEFDGTLSSTERVHHAGANTTTVATAYTYDHMGRKKTTSQSINGAPATVLSEHSYNELGQLKEKKLADGRQSTQYSYNERGWLRTSSSNEFSMELKYETGSYPQYNGNIADQTYTNSNSNGFTYQYDRLNRLTTAAATGMSEVISYDVMGNITSLNRDNAGAKTYNYENGGLSNRLSSVTGLTGTNYQYDGNGNATTDGRNGVTLSYNYLNLPSTVTGPVNITYTYDATGRKLRKTATGTSTTTTDYINGIQYTNGAIDFIQTEEGRALNSGGTYTYQYNLTDHLGNVRASFDIYNNAVRMLQRDDYYAFGKRKEVQSGGTNRYLYNGKELQDELEQYDYGARFYDPVVGRWNGVDNKAEKYHQFSPYAYAINNPLAYVDIDGQDIIVAFTGGPTGGGKTISASSKDAGSTGRVIMDAQKFADDNGIELHTRVITPGWTAGSSVNNAIGFIKENYTEGQKVIIYGYSYGGDFAVELSEALKKEGIDVNLLITVDASDGPLQNATVNTDIPNNVRENLNFFQTKDSGRSSGSQKSGSENKKNSDSGTSNSPGSNGGRNKPKDSKMTKVNNQDKTGAGVNHGNIPDKVYKEVKKKIQNVLVGEL